MGVQVGRALEAECAAAVATIGPFLSLTLAEIEAVSDSCQESENGWSWGGVEIEPRRTSKSNASSRVGRVFVGVCDRMAWMGGRSQLMDWKDPRRVGDTVRGPTFCPSDDDDDGRGRPVQNKVEASLEESHLWRSGQEDQGPHG